MSTMAIVLAAMQLRLAKTYLTFGKLHAKRKCILSSAWQMKSKYTHKIPDNS